MSKYGLYEVDIFVDALENFKAERDKYQSERKQSIEDTTYDFADSSCYEQARIDFFEAFINLIKVFYAKGDTNDN